MEPEAPTQRTYTILGVIGEGGFGRVYRARLRDADFEKDVAIKMLHEHDPAPDLLARFRDEARILALLRDRAVVSVDPPVKLDDRWAVVMDFVDGLSLGQIVRKVGPLPPAVALAVVAEIARAIDKAYTFPGPDGQPLRLLHRDIKPPNIQLTPSGEVRLLDFGTAWADFGNRESNTQADIAGTPGYIAPERLEGVEGPSGDIFSLGVTLWYALTGERPSARRGSDLATALVELAADNGELAAALSLAIRMRDRYETARPTAKAVQNEARELIRTMNGPFLDEWCANVPHRALEDDALTGKELTEHGDAVTVTTTGVSRSLVYGTGVGMGLFATIAAGAIGILVGLAVLFLVRSSRPQSPVDSVPPEPTEAPVPAEPPPPGFTAISFLSTPDGASVKLDGANIGDTPLAAHPIPDGEHRLVVSKGLFVVSGVIEVGSGGPTEFIWDITQGPDGFRPPLDSQGSMPITITSQPDGAEVWIDGTQLGTTPFSGRRLHPGSHTLELKKGSLSVRREITVEAESSNTWSWVVIQGEAGLTQP